MAAYFKLFYAIAAALPLAGAASAQLDIPLTQLSGKVDPVQHAIYAAAKHGRISQNQAAVPAAPETLDGGFWFGSFNVGNAKNLSLLIDTGSSDVGVNPGLYKPSAASKNLHYSSGYNYATTLEDGCGLSNISFDSYSDAVSFQGLTATNQSLYYIQKQKQTNPGIVVKLPHNGIVGFSGNSAKYSLLGGLPFFYNLCTQKLVKQCRFGLALGTNGKGRQVLGGVDSCAYNGTLARVPISGSEWYTTGNVAVKGSPIIKGVNILFDSGTAGIVASAKQVRTYFKKVGITPHDVNTPGCTPGVFGYYKCDSPPSLGFQLGPHNTTFNVELSALKLADNGNNNCTAWVTGLTEDILPDNFWILGQNWMQGKYVDFNLESNSIGIAALK